MQVLLGLALPNGNKAVPLFDWSAGRILDLVATEDRQEKTRSLRQLLSLDPALLLWAVAHADLVDSWKSLTAENLSQLVLPKLESWLADSSVLIPVEDQLIDQRYQELFQAVNLSRHARQLAESHSLGQGISSDVASTVGLLVNAPSMLISLPESHLENSHLKNNDHRENGTGNDESADSLPAWFLMIRQEVIKGPAIRSIAKLVQQANHAAAETPPLVSEFERNALLQTFPQIRTLFSKLLRRVANTVERQSDYLQRLEKEKLSSLQQLAYGASHEINNPLTNISTRAQTLMHGETNPERRRQLATITSQAYRAHEMIADMMLFAKPPAPMKSRANLIELLNKTIASIRDDVDLLLTDVDFEWEDETLFAEVDFDQLDVAVRAIIKNAAESIQGTGEIKIVARHLPERGQAEISIQDSGQGISAELRNHIFDPFFSGREAGRGLGFGLSKAWRIIQQHQGDILVHSEVGVGTTFSILLPLQRSAT